METTMNTEEQIRQMKEQLALLHKKLDEKATINEKLLKQVETGKLSEINQHTSRWNSASLLLIPFFIWACSFLGLSTWFCIASCIYLLAGVLYTHRTNRLLSDKELNNKNLLEIGESIVKMKRYNAAWAKFGTLVSFIFLCWMSVELSKRNIYSLLIVVPSVGWYTWKRQRKFYRRLNEIQQEIKDYTEGIKDLHQNN